jgi:hypothetical protein
VHSKNNSAWSVHAKLHIISIQRINAEDRTKIEAVYPAIQLSDAGALV